MSENIYMLHINSGGRGGGPFITWGGGGLVPLVGKGQKLCQSFVFPAPVFVGAPLRGGG